MRSPAYASSALGQHDHSGLTAGGDRQDYALDYGSLRVEPPSESGVLRLLALVPLRLPNEPAVVTHSWQCVSARAGVHVASVTRRSLSRA